MKEYLAKYSDPAKTVMGSIATFAIATGLYDQATMALIVGSALAFGTAFWTVYDLAFKK